MPYSINMTVNGDPTSRMAFAWFTNHGITDGEVQMVAKKDATAEDFDSNVMVFNAKAEEVIGLNYSIDKNHLAGITPGEKADYTSHKALAQGLTPGTTYSFRVGKEGAWSKIGTFTTASTDKTAGYSFIYITDTQAQNDEMFDVSQKTVHTAIGMVPEASFILCNGDLVETSGANNSEWEYEQWFSTMQDVWMKYPLVVTQGNHDTSDNHNFAWHFNNSNSYNETASVKTDMDGTVFSFVWGDVLYMVINYEDWKKEGYFNSLANWMRSEVATHKDVKWRVASYHKNMFTGSKSHQDDADGKAVREAMLPVFEELGINIALQGHDHIYEVIGPVKNSSKTLIENEVESVEIVGDGNERANMTGREGGVFNVSVGTLYFLNNSAGKKKYEPRNEQEMIASLSKHEVENYWGLFSGKFGQTGEPTFSRVDVTPDSINVTTYTVDDRGNTTKFDSFKIVKENGGGSGINPAETDGTNVEISYDNLTGITVTGIVPDNINVFSVNGQIIASVTAGKASTVRLNPGIYVVKAQSGNRTYYEKIMV